MVFLKKKNYINCQCNEKSQNYTISVSTEHRFPLFYRTVKCYIAWLFQAQSFPHMTFPKICTRSEVRGCLFLVLKLHLYEQMF